MSAIQVRILERFRTTGKIVAIGNRMPDVQIISDNLRLLHETASGRSVLHDDVIAFEFPMPCRDDAISPSGVNDSALK